MKKTGVSIVLGLLILSGISFSSLKKSFDTKQNEVFIDSMMNNALKKGFFPGAQIIVGSKDSVFILKNYGRQVGAPAKSDSLPGALTTRHPVTRHHEGFHP